MGPSAYLTIILIFVSNWECTYRAASSASAYSRQSSLTGLRTWKKKHYEWWELLARSSNLPFEVMLHAASQLTALKGVSFVPVATSVNAYICFANKNNFTQNPSFASYIYQRDLGLRVGVFWQLHSSINYKKWRYQQCLIQRALLAPSLGDLSVRGRASFRMVSRSDPQNVLYFQLLVFFLLHLADNTINLASSTNQTIVNSWYIDFFIV